MDLIKTTLIKQYNKTMDMLSKVIQDYDIDLWSDDSEYKYPAWQIAYHALYYGNIYCAATEKSRMKWVKQRKNHHLLMKTKKQVFSEIYSKDDILEFLEFFRGHIEGYLEELLPDHDCWPNWYDENQLEFHINNIRHLQHHTAEMIERSDIIQTFSYVWI